MKIKRFIAYIIDIIVVFILSLIIFALPVFSKYQDRYINTTEEVYKNLKESGSAEMTQEENIKFLYDMNSSLLPFLIISAGITLFYFGILSYITNCQTLGKKLMRIKVVPINGNEIKPYMYILREIIITNFIFRIISILTIINCSETKWYSYNSLISNAQTFVYALIIGLMIFRDDERGLHDLIAGTEVIEISKKK